MTRPNEVHDYALTGERDHWDTDEWWCPTGQAWVMCPGPCPDGRAHGPERVTRIEGDVSVSASTGWRRLENATEFVLPEAQKETTR